MVPHTSMARDWQFQYKVDALNVLTSDDDRLSCFRAEGVIKANIFELMAVIADVSRRHEWMNSLEVSKVIEGDLESSASLYEKYNFPWPTLDRDTVTKATTSINYKTFEVSSKFSNSKHSDYPPVEGIVRIPKLEGGLYFKRVSNQETYTRNTFCVNFGGDLPKWLVNAVGEKMPAETLLDLQKQVLKTKGKYQKFVESHQKKTKL